MVLKMSQLKIVQIRQTNDFAFMKISETGYLKIKVMAYFTGALTIVIAILILIIYKNYGLVLLRYQQGWVMPFIFMYIAQFPIIFGGQVGSKVLLSKICGFSFVYLIYLVYVVYKLMHPVSGLPTGLLFSGTLMLCLMPVVYSIGWGIGHVIFLLLEKSKEKAK